MARQLNLPTSTIIVHLKAKDAESAEKVAWKLKDAANVYRKGMLLSIALHRSAEDHS